MLLSRVCLSIHFWTSFLFDARGRGTPMSSRYHLLQTDDKYLWAAAGLSITVILVVLAL